MLLGLKLNSLIRKAASTSVIANLPDFRKYSSFKASELSFRVTLRPKPKPSNADECEFGAHFTDHMLVIDWKSDVGWGIPRITPLENINLHPAASVFHYATEVFEGLKAYRTQDKRIALFRPMENMTRMRYSSRRSCLPEFDQKELLRCICELVRLDQDWVPYSNKASLYVRPTIIGTEASLGLKCSTSAMLFCILCPVGSYFKSAIFNPISLMADPSYVRAFEGGVGAFKVGSNYGPTLLVKEEANRRGCEQVLWLNGEDHQLSEIGTMNIFLYWINEDGEKELATTPLDTGIVLPGVTRLSLIELAKTWGEFKVTERKITMNDIITALKSERVLELFGTGTAGAVTPIDRIHYMEKDLFIPTMANGPLVAKRFFEELTDIQYGRTPHEWSYTVVKTQ